eukprot:TRINITY_DN50038_c0_g1_i1.p1 TRINITY_DN50038_c0_g1~~TRINITY_DN50038_c0_g1_i1.p1  ORF type:complete len:291 (+),score=47.75 TRINITY_DN50038_c0_g1_i1:48-875(+)
MSFSKANPREHDPVMVPRRDRSLSVSRSKAPPVPRAPRAPSKPQSAGALARDMWSGRKSPGESHVISRPSEQRRPREESPFARINMLSRERESVDNQEIEVGPARRRPDRPASADRGYQRGHVLGKESSAFSGIHWSQVSSGEEVPRDADGRVKPRRQVLQREMQDAAQEWEMGPQAARGSADAAAPASSERDFSRRNTLAREQAKAADESHPDKSHSALKADGYHGRRNVLNRECAKDGDTLNMAKPSGVEASGGAPIYNRRNSLEYVAGIGGS